jgi:hypothetical protein
VRLPPSSLSNDKRPAVVDRAKLALWVWLAWTCAIGLYQSWAGAGDIQKQIDDDFQGAISIDPGLVFKGTLLVYVIVAIASAWALTALTRGKHWARSSFMWSFACQALVTISPPYHAPLDYLTDIPDLGLQIYALYLLYTKPGSNWFEADVKRKKL